MTIKKSLAQNLKLGHVHDRRRESALIGHPVGDLCKKGVAAFGRKPDSFIFQGLRHSAGMPLCWMDGFANISVGVTDSNPGQARFLPPKPPELSPVKPAKALLRNFFCGPN
jgi:hypothetical protein